MPERRVTVDPVLIGRAHELTGVRSHRAVVELALRRLIASKQKNTMVDTIAELGDLEAELGAPVEPVAPRQGPSTASGSR